MIRRALRMILSSLVLSISLMTLSSCEEDSEIFEKVNIEKEKQTDQDKPKKQKPGGS